MLGIVFDTRECKSVFPIYAGYRFRYPCLFVCVPLEGWVLFSIPVFVCVPLVGWVSFSIPMSRCVVVTNKTIAPQSILRGDKVVLILKNNLLFFENFQELCFDCTKRNLLIVRYC